ncbi:hypothetical protein JX265_000633 [Neoarthrinium moseri]|uniref:Uncharacterized protein n=1 Tax=Neoarthrinium moseri TaxID=1658444 RepID=A0A9Q0AWG4_9PEZI|nr:uncharacterized protein JN550_001615 [Neoarthrinium moseri]KAI1876119.1 hypothetical protein JN550_001615 [Neoarthrinium moseri]KAI1881807.1 hypothetical protein JX265_000633 [Neoarthrinium moseri]
MDHDHAGDSQQNPPAGSGSPYQEGQNSADKGGGADGLHTTSGAELGIIIGVVAVVIILIAGLFAWRVRKNKKEKMKQQCAKDLETVTDANGDPFADSNRQAQAQAPLAQLDDKRGADSHDTRRATSPDHPGDQQRPGDWLGRHHRSHPGGVEEYEITSRV